MMLRILSHYKNKAVPKYCNQVEKHQSQEGSLDLRILRKFNEAEFSHLRGIVCL